jgi:hypothetical protein
VSQLAKRLAEERKKAAEEAARKQQDRRAREERARLVALQEQWRTAATMQKVGLLTFIQVTASEALARRPIGAPAGCAAAVLADHATGL